MQLNENKRKALPVTYTGSDGDAITTATTVNVTISEMFRH
jgi:hypothetical protein